MATLGQVFMRIVFLAKQDALGFQTAMGALVGEFTSGERSRSYISARPLTRDTASTDEVGRTLLPTGTGGGRLAHARDEG